MPTPNRYPTDVLGPGAAPARRAAPPRVELSRNLVLEDPSTGFCGAVVRWENGLVVLEDRKGRRRSFPLGAGFWLEGRPVEVVAPPRSGPSRPSRTAAGSVPAASGSRARVALPSRILVEGRHDAELVEKIWGDDLRHVGVVVEGLGGVDDLVAVVEEFRPGPGRRLGVLVDHLVPGSKESRFADAVSRGPYGASVLVVGHPFVDIWQAVTPAALGIGAWPDVPRTQDWKTGTCAALGWPHADQADLARVWRTILSRVTSWSDLDRALLTPVETLIDFVTADHADTLEP